MSKRKEMTLHDKAVRLCEGGVVECSGHYVRAKEIPDGFCPCMECSMDSACDMEMTDLCAECDGLTRTPHILFFNHKFKQ